jgi:hypothetical protein
VRSLISTVCFRASFKEFRFLVGPWLSRSTRSTRAKCSDHVNDEILELPMTLLRCCDFEDRLGRSSLFQGGNRAEHMLARFPRECRMGKTRSVIETAERRMTLYLLCSILLTLPNLVAVPLHSSNSWIIAAADRLGLAKLHRDASATDYPARSLGHTLKKVHLGNRGRTQTSSIPWTGNDRA